MPKIQLSDDHSEFCKMCGVAVVYTRGAVCHACAAKALRFLLCGKNHSIVARIINGRSACVIKGGEVVHIGRGCEGCRFESN